LDFETIDGTLLGRILEGALRWLSQHRREIDALNVFPVPDGDTGSNMLATLEAAVAALGAPPPAAVSAAAEAAAKGALMGARGNSGVILSQIIRGFAAALTGKEKAGVQDIAAALATGTEYAYRAVETPVEGTILTVVKDTAKEARDTANRSRNLLRLLTYILRASSRSLAQTPELLPVLKEAGVVDAGGRGFTAILEGILQAVVDKRAREGLEPYTGKKPDARSAGALLGPLPADRPEDINFTYCTEFLCEGTDLDAEAIKRKLSPRGDCLMVVGEKDILRIHIHCDHPGEVLEIGLGYGSLHNIRINNMRDQFQEVKRDKDGVAVVSVCTGEGFAALFANLGAVVVSGGQTMNPSAGEIAAAVNSTGAGTVIILPNNPNIILAAQQVRDLTECEVHVIPSNSMPQGLSAMLAFSPEESVSANTGRMQAAAAKVATVEITCAVREAKIGAKEVQAGDILAIFGEELVASGNNLGEVTVAAMQKTAVGMNLVTLYYGSEVEPSVAEEMAAFLSAALPGVELEIQYGGQPFYQFLAAIE
jgi:hypothetical protein